MFKKVCAWYIFGIGYALDQNSLRPRYCINFLAKLDHLKKNDDDGDNNGDGKYFASLIKYFLPVLHSFYLSWQKYINARFIYLYLKNLHIFLDINIFGMF